MKSNTEIVDTIKAKRLEHETIIKQMSKDIEIVRAKLAEMIQAKVAKDVLFPQTNALMVLKDKMMFHKAAILVYDDLLKDVGA